MEFLFFDINLPSGFWDLSNKEKNEFFIRNSDYKGLRFCHWYVEQNLIKFLTARDILQLHGEYPSL